MPTCRRCGSPNLVKNGHNQYGSQQFRCKACGKSAVLKPKYSYTEAEKARIVAAYQEHPSLRRISRLFGISRNTLVAWLKKSPTPASPQGPLIPAGADGPFK